MRKKFRQKLRSRRGETLAETLFAVLITALAATLLLMMVSTSSRMDRKADVWEKELYAALSDAEAEQNPRAEEGSITVTVFTGSSEQPGETGNAVTFDHVKFYGDADSLASYRWEGAE